jgi:hypothetical protein
MGRSWKKRANKVQRSFSVNAYVTAAEHISAEAFKQGSKRLM